MRLAELHAQPLGDRRWLVVFVDGFRFGEHQLVGALGATADGTKVPLGVVEGSTSERGAGYPAAAPTSPTVAGGLDPSHGLLLVVDGSKAQDLCDPQRLRQPRRDPEV